MAYTNEGRSAPRSGSQLLPGILIGMVLGLVIAGGLAWYLRKSPGQFTSPEKTIPEKTTAPTPAAPASGVSNGKPRFEFYKVLTDKQDSATPEQKGGDKTVAGSKPSTPASQEIYFLQAGSFSSAEDADKLKARLAMLGMEATVQIAIIPDKGTYHRVRLGPYKGAEEMNRSRAVLKQNGVEAAPMRAQ